MQHEFARMADKGELSAEAKFVGYEDSDDEHIGRSI